MQKFNIDNVYNFIQRQNYKLKKDNGVIVDVAYFFRIDFIKLDETDGDYISLIHNSFLKYDQKSVATFLNALKSDLKKEFNFNGKIYF